MMRAWRISSIASTDLRQRRAGRALLGKTIAQLQATMATGDGESNIVDGYYAEGDGGGGEFHWHSPVTPDAPDNIRIIGASSATPIQITTAAAHGLSTGRKVMIGGVGGNTAANGTWTITVRSSTTFDLDTSTWSAG